MRRQVTNYGFNQGLWEPWSHRRCRSRCVGTVAAPHERCWMPQKQILDLKVNQHLSALQLVELMAHILYCRFSERLLRGSCSWYMLDIVAGAKDLADVVGCTGLANPEFETTVSTPHLTKWIQLIPTRSEYL